MTRRTPRMQPRNADLVRNGPGAAALTRRQLLSFTTAFAIGAPASARPVQTGPRARIRAICFDLFTILDPRSVVRAADAIVPQRGAELWTAWKARQFEYSWLRAAAGRYADFRTVTAEALLFAANDRKLSLSLEERARLVDAYSELEPWPDTRSALRAWKSAGLRLAPLTNYSPEMLKRVLSRSGLTEAFDALLSTHAVKSYKPDPRAYGLGPAVLRLAREQIAFAAFGGWDAAGAKWFGFPTFWVNRLGVTAEQLVAPDATGPDFASLAKWLASW
jgi:2-haloacid dehalogenase